MIEPFFKKYIDLVETSADLIQMMRDQGAEVNRFLETVSEPASMQLHSPYTWTLKEVVNHLSDCERVFSFRSLWIARGGTMPMVSFDENEFSVRATANEFSIGLLASEFEAVRRSTISFFENLPKSAWNSVGHVFGQDITVELQASILVGHVAHHWRIIKKRFSF